jgi:hypothetical protein
MTMADRAKLEGYEQMERRMADLHAELSATRVELGTGIEGARPELAGRIDRVGARVDMVLYGVAVAILVPIFLRVFLH